MRFLHSKLDADRLLNASIEMAKKLLERLGGFLPFGIVITVQGGKEVKVAVDDTDLKDPQAIADLLRQKLREGCAKLEFRCVALVRNITRIKDDGRESTEIQVTVEPMTDEGVTCYLPFQLSPQGVVDAGPLYATKPVERFYPEDLQPPAETDRSGRPL